MSDLDAMESDIDDLRERVAKLEADLTATASARDGWHEQACKDAAEAKRLEAELAEVTDDRDALLVELTGSCDGPGLREENARLREVLRSYAHRHAYVPRIAVDRNPADGDPGTYTRRSWIDEDKGATARKALEESDA